MLAAILRWTDRHINPLRKSQRTTLGYMVAGLIVSGRAGVAAIGRGLPGAAYPKHKIKRADRFLGNERVNLAVLSRALLWWATGAGQRLVLALDWTDLPGGKKMLTLSVPTRGRALPVHSRVVDEGRMHKSQNYLEEGLLRELTTLLPPGRKPVIVADRGFGRTRLMQQLTRWEYGFVLRVKGDAVFRCGSVKRRVQAVPLRRGQTLVMPRVQYRDEEPVEVDLVCTWRRRMREPWYLATNLHDLPASEVIGLYGRRMQIEETFRDVKSVRFGFKVRQVRLTSCGRWERLMLVVGLATLLLLAVGAQAERQRRHRRWMANTSRRRTLSWLTLGRACFAEYARRLGRWVRLLRPMLVQA